MKNIHIPGTPNSPTDLLLPESEPGCLWTTIDTTAAKHRQDKQDAESFVQTVE